VRCHYGRWARNFQLLGRGASSKDLLRNGKLTSRIWEENIPEYTGAILILATSAKPLISGDLYFWGGALLRRPSEQQEVSWVY
jgi:hypothetical protein